MQKCRLKWIVGIVAALLMLYVAWTGEIGIVYQFRQATGAGRMTQSISQLVYCVSAVLCVAMTGRSGWWPLIARWSWVVSATLAGGLAPTFWGGAPARVGLTAGAASCGVAIGVLWMLRQAPPRWKFHDG